MAKKGEKQPEEWKRNMSKLMKGNTNGKFCKGIIKSKEMREKIRNGVLKHYKEHPETIEKIKKARKNQKVVYESKHEKLMQDELIKNGFKIKKHKYITITHGYQCDIFIEPNIIIEVDGEYWHNRIDKIRLDNFRNKELKEAGYKVFRIKALSFLDKNYKINREVLDKFIGEIKDDLD